AAQSHPGLTPPPKVPAILPRESHHTLAKPATPPVKPALGPRERSPMFVELTKLRAYEIWSSRGRPTGAAGAAVEREIWLAAGKQMDAEVDLLAYQIWESRGGAGGAKGEAQRAENRAEAERRLLVKKKRAADRGRLASSSAKATASPGMKARTKD